MINIAKKLSKSNNFFANFTYLVALISVAIGNIALLVSLSVLNGFDNSLRDIARKFTSDVRVQAINGNNLNDISNKINDIIKLDNVESAYPVIQTEAIVQSKSFTEGIILQTTSPLSGSLKGQGHTLVGKMLAKKLDVDVGDKITLYAIKNKEHIAFSSAAYSSFVVDSFYNTGMAQYDNSVIFMPYSILESFLEYEKNTASFIEVELKDIKKAAETAVSIDEILGYPIFSITYYDINSSIFSWIELQKAPVPLVLAIISIVASLNIMTMLIIIVVEKANAIGILRTLGLTRQLIVRMFMYLALRIALIGALIGVGASVLFVFIQSNFSLIELDSKIYFIDSLPVSLDWRYIIAVVILTLVLSICSALIPAMIAVRILPLSTIRFR